MSDVPTVLSDDQILENVKNHIREIAAGDDLDRELALIEEEKTDSAQSSSRRKNQTYVDREREAGHDRLVRDYFSDNPTFGSQMFRHQFRMRRELLLRIVDALKNHSSYFKLRQNATRRKGLSPLQKCTATICQLAYASPADSLDEYIGMGEKLLKIVYSTFVDVFGARYLRRPNIADTQRLVQMHEQRHGFPRMLGSLDCIHWE